jgi:hypothetical protein
MGRLFYFNMKLYKTYLIISLLFSTFVIRSQVNINTGTPPPWGFSGYPEVRYYYLPDIEVYYDLHTDNFIYFDGTNWIYSQVLPLRYAYYDLYSGYKVLINDYFGPKPQLSFRKHKIKYPRGYKGPPPEVNPGRSPSELYRINNKTRNKNKKEN